MEFLAAKVWILFWIAWTVGMLCCAYYARNEAIQKVASALFVAWVITHVFAGDIYFYALTDLTCLVYCIYIWRTIERSNPVPQMVAAVFAAMLAVHAMSVGHTLGYDLTLSVLYAAQLIVLCGYSKKYGKVARQSPPQNRDDPFHKIVVWLKPHTTH